MTIYKDCTIFRSGRPSGLSHIGSLPSATVNKTNRSLRWLCLFFAALALSFLLQGVPHAEAQSCSTAGLSIDYGSLNAADASPTDVATTLNLFCSGTPGQVIRLCIELSPGSFALGSGQRAMGLLANRLQHDVYIDSARTQILGSWGSVVAAYTPSPTGATVDILTNAVGNGTLSLPVYGRVFGNQSGLTPGAYFQGGNEVGVRYGYATGASCPVGSQSFTGSSNFFATVENSCVVTATSLNFGSTGSFASNLDAAGSVTVNCPVGVAYSVGLSSGLGAGATTSVRKLTGPSSTVDYEIYSNSARTSIWGDTIGTDTVSGTGIGSAQVFSTYGRVPVQAIPAPGSYSDTVVVTVTY